MHTKDCAPVMLFPVRARWGTLHLCSPLHKYRYKSRVYACKGSEDTKKGIEYGTGLLYATEDDIQKYGVRIEQKIKDQDIQLPDKFDMTKMLGPPDDQGQHNTCACFTTAGGLKALLRANGRPVYEYSQSYLYAQIQNCIKNACPATEGDGTSLLDNERVIQDCGCPTITDWQYETASKALNITNMPLRIVNIGKAAAGGYGHYIQENNSIFVTVKNLMLLGCVVTVSIDIYGTQNNSGDSRFLTGKLESSPRDDPKGHAVILAGWDNTKATWYFKNSWGPTFGAGSGSLQGTRSPTTNALLSGYGTMLYNYPIKEWWYTSRVKDPSSGQVLYPKPQLAGYSRLDEVLIEHFPSAAPAGLNCGLCKS